MANHISSMVVSAVCVKCGESFFLRDLVVNATQKVEIPLQPKIVLKTWSDWIAHAITHCPQCCYERPPLACQNDFAGQRAERKNQNKRIREEDEK